MSVLENYLKEEKSKMLELVAWRFAVVAEPGARHFVEEINCAVSFENAYYDCDYDFGEDDSSFYEFAVHIFMLPYFYRESNSPFGAFTMLYCIYEKLSFET